MELNESTIETLDKIVRKAATQLFGAHRCELVETERQELTNDVFASTIGFTASPARGSLVLAVSAGVLGRSLPIPDMPRTPKNLSDWAGEMSNQLLGRIKNQLVPFGLEIELSIPVVVMGKDLSCFGVEGAVQRSASFQNEGDIVDVHFFVSEADAWELDESHLIEEDDSLSEGDVELF